MQDPLTKDAASSSGRSPIEPIRQGTVGIQDQDRNVSRAGIPYVLITRLTDAHRLDQQRMAISGMRTQ